MFNKLLGFLVQPGHFMVLKSFDDDKLLPLDGSNWCRLVNIRRRREHCANAECPCRHDYLFMVHSREVPLVQGRTTTKEGRTHWFRDGGHDYCPDIQFRALPTFGYASKLAMSHLASLLDKQRESTKKPSERVRLLLLE